MKKHLIKLFVFMSILLSVGLISQTAQAWRAYISEPAYYNYNYTYGSGYRWEGGHWYRGYWYPARKVYYHRSSRCGWVAAHWYRGEWYPSHRACW